MRDHCRVNKLQIFYPTIEVYSKLRLMGIFEASNQLGM
jgi:hypothetical protein